MQTLHKLRYFFLRHDSGHILHCGVGQLNPHGIVERQCIIFGKMLCKCGGISVRCALAVVERMGKSCHGLLVNLQRAAELSHDLYQLQHTNTTTVFHVKGGNCTDFLCRLNVRNDIFYVCFIEKPVNFCFVCCQIQKRERLRFLQESDDLQQSFLCHGEHGHIHVARTEHKNYFGQWLAERCKFCDLFIGDVECGTANRANRNGLFAVCYLVLPKIKCQQILIKDAHVPASDLSCLSFSSIIPYICDKI